MNTRLKVIGVGGAGINAVNALLLPKLQDVDLVVVAASEDALKYARAAEKLLFTLDDAANVAWSGQGNEVTTCSHQLYGHLRDVDIIVIAAGMGGATGTQLAPIIARLAMDAGALVCAIVTKPFASEGKSMMRKANAGIERLLSTCDCVVAIPNDHLPDPQNPSGTLFDIFKVYDDMLRDVIMALTEQGRKHGDCYVDLNRIRTILTIPGIARVAVGVAEGRERAALAAGNSMTSRFLRRVRFCDAAGLIISVASGGDITVEEYDEIIRLISEGVDRGTAIVSGLAIADESLEGQVKVTIIATGMREVLESVAVNQVRPSWGFFSSLVDRLLISRWFRSRASVL